VPAPFFAPFHQTPIMPVRKVGGGPAKVSKVYKPLKTDPEWYEPVRVDPDEVGPPTPAKDKPRETPAPAPFPMKPPPPTKFPPPPQRRVPTQDFRIPAKPAAKSTFVPSPITQPLPTPGPSSDPSTWNALKSQRSVPTLLSASLWLSCARARTDRTLV
jgi:hypothetical protein